jgi:hypothetical protein
MPADKPAVAGESPPNPRAPVRLRPHHLLCLLTYAGKGYSEAFTAGFDAIVSRLALGAEIEVVDGPDDICAPLRHDAAAHCHRDSVRWRDRQAAADLSALRGQAVAAGERLTLDAALLSNWRQAFAQGRTRAACGGCEWQALCSAIAAQDFAASRLQPMRWTRRPPATA